MVSSCRPERAQGFLFIAGQIGCDAQGHIVSATFAGQFDQALFNVISVVEAMRGRPEAIGKLTIFVTDMQAYLDARKEIGVAIGSAWASTTRR